MIYKYLIGAAIGGLFGYFVLYKLIGCSSGACPITKNPIASTVAGVVLGVLLTFAIFPTQTPAENNNASSMQSVVVSENSAESSTSSVQSTVVTYQKISAQDAKARMDSGDSVIILDVRTAEEYAAGHIPNAILIPNETIIDTQPALLPDLNAEILVYCRSGNRSAQAAKKLIAMGYTNVYDFGGIIDWPYETVTGAN